MGWPEKIYTGTVVFVAFGLLTCFYFIFKIDRTRKKKPSISFHLNEIIKVKLTDRGYEYLAQRFNSQFRADDFGTRDAEYYKAKADADGYTAFVAWDFMRAFGSEMKIAGPDYFHLDIVVVKPREIC